MTRYQEHQREMFRKRRLAWKLLQECRSQLRVMEERTLKAESESKRMELHTVRLGVERATDLSGDVYQVTVNLWPETFVRFLQCGDGPNHALVSVSDRARQIGREVERKLIEIAVRDVPWLRK